jgi:uncharacterized protein
MKSRNKSLVGKYHTLRVAKIVDFGVYLDTGEDELLVPRRYVPEGTEPDDELRVFVYRDSEDRLIATTQQPYTTVNSFAYLRVKETSRHGVFMDWGLDKDLFVPFAEQNKKMVAGQSYLVWVYVDPETDRLVASSRLDKFLTTDVSDLSEELEVDLIVWEFTELGAKVIVDQLYNGMIFRNDIFSPLQIGDRLTGYIQTVRPDGKLDIRLRKKGYAEVRDAKQQLLEKLIASQYFLPLTDNSSPEEIYEQLHMSKKVFKKALGGLLKDRLIILEEKGIRYIAPE